MNNWKECLCLELEKIAGRVMKRKEKTSYQKVEFLKSLSEYLGVDVTREVKDSLLLLHVDFALNTNARGRQVVNIVRKYTPIKRKRFLDVGCAYGGFLVAFAEAGAKEVVGIDINEKLLKLARANASDNSINAIITRADILDEDLPKTVGEFDIITCNDVIEHVEDPMRTIVNLSNLLRDGGILYMEIPNRYYVGFLKEDGHFKLPGITLLPKWQAEQYHHAIFGCEYTVGHYKSLQWYFYHLMRNSIYPKLINFPTITESSTLVSEFNNAISILDSFSDSRINGNLEPEIKKRAKKLARTFSREVEECSRLKKTYPKTANYAEQEILHRYGTDFWEIIGVKQ